MDDKDIRILGLLQQNARMPNRELARQLDMAPSGTLERIKKLEKNNIIRGYHARIDPKQVGRGLLAFLFVRTSDRVGDLSTARALAAIDEILEVHHMSGDDCYLVKVRTHDTQTLADFMRAKLNPIDSITTTNTLIVFETIKETSDLTLHSADE